MFEKHKSDAGFKNAYNVRYYVLTLQIYDIYTHLPNILTFNQHKKGMIREKYTNVNQLRNMQPGDEKEFEPENIPSVRSVLSLLNRNPPRGISRYASFSFKERGKRYLHVTAVKDEAIGRTNTPDERSINGYTRGMSLGKVETVKKIFFSNKEAEAYLGVGDSFLKYHRTTGEIPYYRAGKAVFYRKSDLDKFVESHRIV